VSVWFFWRQPASDFRKIEHQVSLLTEFPGRLKKLIYPGRITSTESGPAKGARMVSIAEFRHIMESGFLPLACDCSLNSDGSLRINIFDPTSGRVDLLLTRVSPQGLDSIRSISNLIGELRTEIKAGRRGFAAFG